MFEDEYRRKYGAAPGVLADNGYDAARLLIEAYAANPDATAMMSWIKGRRDYDGASGKLSFDSSGDVVKPYRLKRGMGGQFVSL
jgi:ABC-type branched-subunit amino acid transport system substrate-binding protein